MTDWTELLHLGLIARNENVLKSPERSLCCSLILTAALDALDNQPLRDSPSRESRDRLKAKVKEEALIWLGLHDDSDQHSALITFSYACEAIDRDPDRVRKAIKEFISKHKKVDFFPNPPICERMSRE